MLCPSCGVAALPGQAFCTECGAAVPVAGAPLPPPTIAAMPAPAAPAALPTVAAPVTPAPVAPTPVAPTPITGSFDVVEQTSPPLFDQAQWATGVVPVVGHTVGPGPTDTTVVAATRPFRITPLVAVSAITAVLAVATAFVNIVSYKVTGDAIVSQAFKLNDFATNHTVAVIIGAVLLVAGSVLGATGRRLGAGLAGGVGLALAGLLANAVGTGTAVLDATQIDYLGRTTGNFTLTTTQELGYFLLIAAAAFGALTFVLSLRDAGRDGRPPLSPVVGAVGALGAVAVAVGPLFPQYGAVLGDNFSQDALPPVTLYLRCLLLALILLGGVVGFLLSRRFGLGMAIGAISIGVWQTITALAEAGDRPFGIAGGNFNPDPAHPFMPHLVTIIGVSLMVLSALGGLLTIVPKRAR